MGHAARQLDLVSDPRAAATLLEPTRLRLMSELQAKGEGSATDLGRRVGLARQKVNYHLRELERAGLVELVDARKKGNCVERIVRASARAYLVAPQALGALAADPARVHDRLSSAYLIALCAQTIAELGEVRERAERAGKKAASMTIQTEVAFASAQAMNSFAEELTRHVVNLTAKYHTPNEPGARLFKVFAGAYSAITKDEEPPENT